MFFTPRPSKDTPNYQWQTTPSSALHNAHYAGWLNTPVRIPHGASPSRREHNARHVTFDIPSHSSHEDDATYTHYEPVHSQYDTHHRTASASQAARSSDTMGTSGYRTRRSSSSQGTFEMRTGARHDKENGEIRHDPPTRRTNNHVSSSTNKFPIASPHPLLAAPSVPQPLIYDLRHTPTALSFPSSSPQAGCGYEILRVPLTRAQSRYIRLISPDFPWSFDVRGSGGEGVTCLEVLTVLHDALQHPLTDAEWGSAGDDKHASLLRARDRRLAIIPHNSGARTRSAMHFADENQRSVGEPVVLRVDWLGSRVAFGGLVKDDTFARRRLIPGAKEPPETWVVNLRRG